jgi:hypothetical protein
MPGRLCKANTVNRTVRLAVFLCLSFALVVTSGAQTATVLIDRPISIEGSDITRSRPLAAPFGAKRACVAASQSIDGKPPQPRPAELASTAVWQRP